MLMAGLINDSWILIPASEFSQMQYIVLVKVYKENTGLYWYELEKGGVFYGPFQIIVAIIWY